MFGWKKPGRTRRGFGGNPRGVTCLNYLKMIQISRWNNAWQRPRLALGKHPTNGICQRNSSHTGCMSIAKRKLMRPYKIGRFWVAYNPSLEGSLEQLDLLQDGHRWCSRSFKKRLEDLWFQLGVWWKNKLYKVQFWTWQDGADIELHWRMHINPDRILSLDTEVRGEAEMSQHFLETSPPLSWSYVLARQNMGSRLSGVLQTSWVLRHFLNKPEGVLSEFPTLEIEMDGTTREFYLFATFFFITW